MAVTTEPSQCSVSATVALGMTDTTISSVGEPSLLKRDRYLIAGDDHFVWPCGFSQPYQSDIAAQWAATLAS